jgi:hypothetical protein
MKKRQGAAFAESVPFAVHRSVTAIHRFPVSSPIRSSDFWVIIQKDETATELLMSGIADSGRGEKRRTTAS